MVRVFYLVLFSFIAINLTSCSVFGKKDYDQQLKSPCVGINGSPCEHIPVNNWWLPQNMQYKVNV